MKSTAFVSFFFLFEQSLWKRSHIQQQKIHRTVSTSLSQSAEVTTLHTLSAKLSLKRDLFSLPLCFRNAGLLCKVTLKMASGRSRRKPFRVHFPSLLPVSCYDPCRFALGLQQFRMDSLLHVSCVIANCPAGQRLLPGLRDCRLHFLHWGIR